VWTAATGSEHDMKKRTIAVLVLALVVGGGITIVVLTQRTEVPQQKTPEDPAAGFVPRRTRAELEKGIAEARAEREKLAAHSAPTPKTLASCGSRRQAVG